MGKKNLLKSTTKKKGTGKATENKSDPKKAASKKTAAKKSTTKKSASAKNPPAGATTKAKKEADIKAKEEAEAKAKAEEEARAKAEAEAKAKAEEEARAKAEAEAKAKAEEEARAKAEAEARAKAEAKAKAEARATSHPEPVQPERPPVPPPSIGESDTVKKLIIALSICLVLIIIPILYTSISNTAKYYLKPRHGALEIWKGSFSPTGEHMVVKIPGAFAPETIKEVYSKNEVYPLACNYYLEKADAVLNIAGMPDFALIRNDLEKAMAYAVTDELKAAINQRLTFIDLAILTYKADLSAAKGTVEGYEAAIGYLAEAARLDLDDNQAELVESKTNAFTSAMESAAAGANEAPESEIPESLEIGSDIPEPIEDIPEDAEH